MNRPTSVTVVAAAAFSGAILLALTAFAFLLVGGMVVTGADRGDPVSVAIVGMAVAGGFSLLILGSAVACLAIGLWELRAWPSAAFVAPAVADVWSRLHSLLSRINHTWTVGFPPRNKNRRPEFRV
jgi:hypothetical protein